jgi:hypothetical protein
MFNGPLSERIDWIIEKPQGDNRPEEKQKKPRFAFLSTDQEQKDEHITDLWDTTQVHCPFPPRNPDCWIQ